MLSVINIYLYPEIAMKKYQTYTDRVQLCKELDNLEAIAKTIKKYNAQKLPRKPELQRIWKTFFNHRLSPHAPQVIRSGHQGWHQLFTKAVQLDREQLSGNSEKPTYHIDHQNLLSQLDKSKADIAFTLSLEQVERYIGFGKKVIDGYIAQYNGRPPKIGNYSKYYLAASISDICLRLNLEHLNLKFVEVTDYVNSIKVTNQPITKVDIFNTLALDSSFIGVVLRLRVRHPENPSKMLQANLVFRWNASNRVKLNGQIQSTELCERIAAILICFLKSTKHLSWKTVWNRINSYTNKSPEPTLLETLTYYTPYLEKLSFDSISKIIPRIKLLIKATSWYSIRENLIPIIDIWLSKASHHLSDKKKCSIIELYKEVYKSCPKEASVNDIKFLIQFAERIKSTTEEQKQDLFKYNAYILEAISYDGSKVMCLNCKNLLKYDETRPYTDTKDTLEKIEDEIINFIKDSDIIGIKENTTKGIRNLSRLFEIAKNTGIAPTNLKLKLANFIADYPKIPMYIPGLWHTKNQIEPFWGIFRAFCFTAASKGISQIWNIEKIEQLMKILPTWTNDSYPCRFPSSFWPLVRNWLKIQDQEKKDCINYYLDVSREFILRPYECSTRLFTDIEIIVRFKKWLKEELSARKNTDSSEIYSLIIQLMLERFDYNVQNFQYEILVKETADALIAFITGGSKTKDKKVLCCAIELFLEMNSKGIASMHLPTRWLSELCQDNSYDWKKEFLPFLISCILTGEDKLKQNMKFLISKFNPQNLTTDELDNQLICFERLVWEEDSSEKHLSRLTNFSNWYYQDETSLFNQWNDFLIHHPNATDSDFQHKTLLILSASLRINRRPNLLKRRVLAWLWPSVLGGLIEQNKSINEINSFLELMKNSRIDIISKHKNTLAMEVLSSVEMSNGRKDEKLKSNSQLRHTLSILVNIVSQKYSTILDELMNLLPQNDVVHFAKVLTCIPCDSLSGTVKNELWSLAIRYYHQDSICAAKIVDLASRI